MNQEIERKYAIKYLPKDLQIERVIDIEQGFTYKDMNTIVRVRKIQEKYPSNKVSYIYTVKTKGDIQYNKNEVSKKYEIESEIEQEQYEKLIKRKISNIIDKTRIVVPIQNELKAEIDVYYGYLEGFLTLEVEFENEEEANNFQRPDWFGEELGYKELSNKKLSMMTRKEFESKVTKEFMDNNKEIIHQLERGKLWEN